MGKDTSYSSIWLFDKGKELPPLLQDTLASPIGRQSPTGGKHYSEFNPTVCRRLLSFWSEPNDYILDPFAGRTRVFMSLLMDRNYIGFELSKGVYDYLVNIIGRYNKETLFPMIQCPRLINDDSYNLDNYNLPLCDMVFTCPPYWNLEQYYAGDGDLSAIEDYREFLTRYRAIMEKSASLLKLDKYMIVVVGDFRKNGTYVPFHSDNIKVLSTIEGLKLHDIICLQSVTFDIANFRFGGFSKNHIVAKVHEFALVYKKVLGGKG